jgi:hypothetical protein
MFDDVKALYAEFAKTVQEKKRPAGKEIDDLLVKHGSAINEEAMSLLYDAAEQRLPFPEDKLLELVGLEATPMTAHELAKRLLDGPDLPVHNDAGQIEWVRVIDGAVRLRNPHSFG